MIETRDVNQAIADLIHDRTPEQWLAAMNDVLQVADECRMWAEDAVGRERAKEHVKAGAAYLDQTYPGWRDKVHDRITEQGGTWAFRVSSPLSCPLSIATGDFLEAAETRGLVNGFGGDYDRTVEWLTDHGFFASSSSLPGYDHLQTAWEAELGITRD